MLTHYSTNELLLTIHNKHLLSLVEWSFL